MDDTIGSSIYSDVPLLDRIQTSSARVLSLVFVNTTARFVWDMLFLAVVAVVFTQKLNLGAAPVWARVLVYVLLVILFFAYSYLVLMVVLPRISRWVLGAPVFGGLGGVPRVTFFTMLKCANAISFEFSSADQERVKEFDRMDRDITELNLKNAYRAALLRELNQAAEPSDFAERWAGLWQDRILKVSTKSAAGETLTLDAAMAEDNFAWRVQQLALVVVPLVVAPIALVFQIVVIYLIGKYLDNQINLVALIQGALFFSLVISLLLFNFHAHQNAEIVILDPALTLAPDVAETVAPRLQKIGRAPFRPVRVKMQKEYLSLVRDYFGQYMFWFGGVMNALTSLVFLGLALLLGFIFVPASAGAALIWYRDMAIALVLVPFGLLAGYYVAFLTLQNARTLVAPIIVGLLAAVLPYALSFVFTGKLDLTQVQNSLLAAGTGIGAALVAAITAQVKSRIEGDK